MAETEGFILSSDSNRLSDEKCTHPDIEIQGFFGKVATPLSPLDRSLTLTRFNSKVASKKREVETTLRDLESKIKSIVKPDKDSLPWLKLASFGDDRTDKNSLRHDANVLHVHGIECDYDAGAMTIGQAAKLLKEANLAALLYESASSTLFEPRFRVLCPCSTSLAPQERKQLVARVNGVLGGTLDGASFNLSQAFLFGGIEGQPTPRTELVEGRYIDQAHDLDAGAIGRRAKADSDGETVAATDESGSGAAFRKAMQLQLAGETAEAFEDWAVDNPWNDYEANPERAIERTWERAGREAGQIALAERASGTVDFEDLGPDPASKPRQGLNATCAADLEPENIEWVWPQRLASGKISILAGDPGQGKSQISLQLASVISKGSKWPDGGNAPKGSIVILSAEDGARDTTVPRLMAAGADLRKVQFVRSVTDKGKDRSFNLGADIKQLGELCDRLGDVVLVVIDPITSYLGNIDSHRTGDVRAVLEPLGNWAEQARVAVLAISHPPKAAQAKAINAITGSLAFVAAARVVMVAIADPETKGRSLLLPVKINIGQSPKGLGYRIEGRTVEGSKGPIATSAIAWDDKEVTLTADEALNSRREPGRPVKAANEAEAFLRGRLGFGAVPAKDVVEEAEAEGFSKRTLDRAKANLGVVVKKTSLGGGWTWELDWGV
jgi:putative DNA primase/helicase